MYSSKTLINSAAVSPESEINLISPINPLLNGIEQHGTQNLLSPTDLSPLSLPLLNSTGFPASVNSQTIPVGMLAQTVSLTSNRLLEYSDRIDAAITAEGVITINNGGDFDGDPLRTEDDALLYAGRGFTINRSPILPVRRDATGDPILEASGKPILVDSAIAVAAGYSVLNAPNHSYAGLVPPQIVDQRTVNVPTFNTIRDQELAARIPANATPVVFEPNRQPLNNAEDWARFFPPGGTVDRPTVVRVTGQGLTIPDRVTLENTIILLDRGNILFNGSDHQISNVVLVAQDGTVDLSGVQANDLTVLAGRSIHMNREARFSGNTLLANGDCNGITLNGATATTTETDLLTVIAQGRITYNADSDTRGQFISLGDFSYNSTAELIGSISTKSNIYFNSSVKITALASQVVDRDPPDLSVQIENDTGASASDRLTFDPTLTGTLTDSSQISQFFANLNNQSFAVDVTSDLQNGRFRFTRDRLAQINGGDLPDGSYTLRLQAQDQQGNQSNILNFSFDLDTTAPSLSLDLLPAFDSAPLGDRQTQFNSVTLAGQTEAGLTVSLQPTGATVVTSNAGQFTFANIALQTGDNSFTASTTDLAGNQGVVNQTITRVTSNLQLQEGSFFSRSIERSLTIPQSTSTLRFSFSDLQFDTTDPNAINDAFEVALVDANGNSLVHTIAKGRDAFFNLTEGQSAALATGATLNGQTVTLNLAGIAPGTEATLILRLVNNDADTTTAVRITNLEVVQSNLAAPEGVVLPATRSTSFAFLSAAEYAQFSDVSASFRAEYGQTSFNADTNTLYTELAVRNAGQYRVDTPLLVAVDRISDPSVRVANAQGITPDGLPYFDFSNLARGQALESGAGTTAQAIAFFNPNGVQFDYDLVFLERLTQPELSNQLPEFTSTPIETAVAGQPYVYAFSANDPNSNSLTYKLLSAPVGMTIENTTGRVTWLPTATDVGSQSVILQVDDGVGGSARQSFNIVTQLPTPSNYAPVIISTPNPVAGLNQFYTYDVDAIDPDGDPLTYSLLSGPQGMAIDAATGLLTWNTGNQTPDAYTVSVQATDSFGNASQSETFALNLSNAAPGEIRGIVWQDLNRNGVRDSDLIQGANPNVGGMSGGQSALEPGQANVRVYLDLNNNNSFDSDEPNQVTAAGTSTTSNLTVQGTDVIFLAGRTDVIIPQLGVTNSSSYPIGRFGLTGSNVLQERFPQSVSAQAGENFTFSTTGSVTYDFRGRPLVGPDGNPTQSSPLNIASLAGISGYSGLEGQLVGVFLGDTSPLNTTAPETLNFRASAQGIGTSFTELAPKPGQVFFIGDGLTGTGSGDAQKFIAPVGASRLYLGFADGFGFSGSPGAYDDNSGSLQVTVSASTAQSGQYQFTGLQPVTYAVREVVPRGYTQTFPGNGTGSIGASAGEHFVTLAAGQTVSDRNFGNVLSGSVANRVPAFVSTAPTNAVTGQTFRYNATAIDPDGDSLTYDLLQAPTGMAVDAQRGVVVWQPAGTQVSEQTVILRARDGLGGASVQTFRLTVGENQSPQITSQPTLFARTDTPYQYQVAASDPEGQPIEFSLLSQPEGMSINPQTGVIQWQPTVNQSGDYRVTVAAQDSQGGLGRQSFTVSAGSSFAPIITSTPTENITAGQTYRYDLQAIDPDGDPIQFTLTQAPQAVTLDALGRLSWNTTGADVGAYTIALLATDATGASTPQTFNLGVQPDQQAPQMDLQVSSSTIEIGKQATFTLASTDNVKVRSLNLSVNGALVAVGTGGVASVQFDAAGLYQVVATATDASGNVGTDTATLRVIDPQDTNAPLIQITSPTTRTNVTTLTEILGSITDTDLESYRIEYAPFSTVDFNNLRLADPDFVTLSTGTASVQNAVLAQFDPTLLLNDDYVVRVTAQDVNGNVNTQGLVLGVTSNNKLGNFRLELTDLSIPLGGIPIAVKRVYDTIQSNQSGDFGFGWSLGTQDARIRESVPTDGLEQNGVSALFTSTPFKAGDRVYLTNPEGDRVGFTFNPVVASSSFFGDLWKPQFTPDAGVFDTLSDANDSARLVQDNNGSFVFPLFGFAYNPSEYNLTTKAGLTYRYDQFEGLEEIRDRNGNTVTFSDAGITSSTGVTVQFARDAQGRITKVIDPTGEVIEYTYDAIGNLIDTIDRSNNETQFAYDTTRPHYLKDITDPLGNNAIRTEYDDQGRLTRIIDAKGNAVNIGTNVGTLTSAQIITDGLGNPTTLIYDDRGNVVQQVDAQNGVTERTYDSSNNLLSLKTPLGNLTTYTYDVQGNLLSQTDPLGQTETYTYNTLNQVLTATDALGNKTQNTYDAQGNRLSTVDAAGKTTSYTYDSQGNVTSITNALNGSTRYQYDTQGRAVSITDALNQKLVLTYDASGNLTSTTTPLGHTTQFTYDASGRPLTITDALSHVSRLEYDAAGNRTASIDALNRRTEYTYSTLGQLTQTLYADGTTEQFTYDVNGQRISATDRAGRTTNYVYDALGRLVDTIEPDATPTVLSDNPRVQRDYDADNRLTAIVDERGNRTAYTYDAAGRQTALQDASGNQTTATYNANGQLTSITDALNRTTELTYNSLGQSIAARYANNTDIATTRDALGRIIAQTDEAGITTQYTYDALGRLTAVSDALGQRTEYGYDAEGNLVSQKDAKGNVTTYSYGAVQELLATTLPLGQKTTATYDAVGNLTSATDFNGQTTIYQYNTNNRVVTTTFADGTSLAYTYTPTLQQATAIDARGATTYTYDEQDRLIAATQPDGKTIRYTYDLAGNKTSETTTAGMVGYTYNALNQLQTVTDPLSRVTTYTYNAAGDLTKTQLPNGIEENRQYDNLDRLISLQQTGTSGTIASYTYTLDATGRRLSETNASGRKVDYTYDLLGRLTQESIVDPIAGNRTIQYAYDTTGNRLTRTDSVEGTTTYTYDANDRLLTEVLNGNTTQYGYDNNGNTVTVAVNGVTQETYGWDAQGKLISAIVNTAQGVQNVQYRYDANGNRVATLVNGQETRYLVDTQGAYSQVVEAYTPDGTPQTAYVRGLNLISQTQQGNQSFDLVDGLGSVRSLTNSAGTLTDQYTYDAFGRLIGQQGTTPNTVGFTGEQFDPTTNLYNLRSRNYDPAIGRFISKDSFGGFQTDPQSLQKYTYAQNDPVNLVDPSGESAIDNGLVLRTSALASLRSLAGGSLRRLQAQRVASSAAVAAANSISTIRSIILSSFRESIFDGVATTLEGIGRVLEIKIPDPPRYPPLPVSGGAGAGNNQQQGGSPNSGGSNNGDREPTPEELKKLGEEFSKDLEKAIKEGLDKAKDSTKQTSPTKQTPPTPNSPSGKKT